MKLTKKQIAESRLERGDYIFSLHHHHDLHDTIDALTAQLTQAQEESEMAERKEYVDFMQYISDWKKMPAKEFAETHGDDILAALGELQREARLAMQKDAANECMRHAEFCRDEANNGGDFKHLMTRADEAVYNAKRILALPLLSPAASTSSVSAQAKEGKDAE